MIRDLFVRLKSNNEELNFGRHILLRWIKQFVIQSNQTNIKLLDIGAGSGEDIDNIRKDPALKSLMFCGIECYQPNIKILSEKDIIVNDINIEKEYMPYEDSYFDIIIANQIIEHTKEIFWIFSEIHRIMKKNGILIIGVPNLASFHNRILLLFGIQPTSIQILSDHVRGFTISEFKKFIQDNEYYNLKDYKGSNFYPFPSNIALFLSKKFPSLSVGIFFLLTKNPKSKPLIEIYKDKFLYTPFYDGQKR